jgi:N-acyl-D-aspartate/D-glutamate deacylase
MATYDLVIRDGDVVDGSGGPPVRFDVGISGGRIQTVGRVPERGVQEVDATGHVVTPGFIDGHTHMDAQLFWDPLGSPSCWHGITTAIMGHCGFTLAPARIGRQDLVIANLERAEDIPRAALEEAVEWSWGTFAEYLDAVERSSKAINYAANVGHSALRTFVMGERAFIEPASQVDVEGMTAELRSGLESGSFGLSTSRSLTHKTPHGTPVASYLATWGELTLLAEVLASSGGGVLQLVEDRLENSREQESRLIDLARLPGVTVAIPAMDEWSLDILDAATAAGGSMIGLSHSRGISVMYSFITQTPFDRVEEWKAVRRLPLDEQISALRDPAVREQLISSAHRRLLRDTKPLDLLGMEIVVNALPPNPTIGQVAAERGVDPVALMIDLSLDNGMQQFFSSALAPLDPVFAQEAMKHPRTVMTFSDAGAHVSQIADFSIQTHLLGYWVRRRGDFTLEEAVRMLSSVPARAWGLHDRGLIQEGMVADINVINPDTVGPLLPTVLHDLPNGGKRIVQKADGFLATIVMGQVTHLHGSFTGALPGRLLRHRPQR